MRIVITGGFGFIGSMLAGELLSRGTLRGHELTSLVLTDRFVPDAPALLGDDRVSAVVGDLQAVIPELFAEPVDAVFHLASAVSAEVEADPDLGMRDNVDTTRALLTQARTQHEGGGPLVTFVFASSVAVYGSDSARPLPPVVDEATLPIPQSSYGIQKLACEQFIADHTRRGHVDGRVVRLMTVAVRPGRPNKAASSFLSSIIREPAAGLSAECPVDPATKVALASPRRTVEGVLKVAEATRGVEPGQLTGRLPVNLPALTVRVADLLDSVRRVLGDEAADLVTVTRDPAVEAIVGSWPARFDNSRALALGLAPDAGIDDVVRAFVEDARIATSPAAGVPPLPLAAC